MKVECIKKLGEGAYANLWLALDEINRSVAVKVMKPEGEDVSSLLQHAEVLVRAKHKNIVEVFSIETVHIPKEGKKSCIVMEFVPGVTFDEFMKNDHKSSELYKVGSQILEGLAHIHKQGLVHLDLHDQNIMITDNKDVKLIDIMYISSLKKVNVNQSNERINYDLRQLRDVLSKLVAASELGHDGLVKFNELSNDVNDFTTIHNAYHDVFTYARDRCKFGLSLLNEPQIHNIRLYKFRAECMTDVLELFKQSNGRILGYRIENDVLPDVDVELTSTVSKSEILNMMGKVDDGHVMIETLESIHEYTGIRS